MALKKQKTEKVSSVSDDDEVLAFLNKNIDEDEVAEEVPRPKTKEDSKNDDSSDYELYREEKKDKGKNVMMFCVIFCVVIVLVCVGVIVISKVSSNKQNKELKEQVSQYQQALDEAKSSSNTQRETKAGAPNLNSNTTDENKASVTGDQLVTNLNGQKVATNYKVKNIQTVRDFIIYTKYRTVTGTGLEFYWLNATYKGNTYIVQVPYQVFKELDDVGVTLVDVEVTTLDDGNNSEIVTYMDVVKNSKSIINGGK